jgi:malonyl-CoA decarboxylase
LAGVSFGNFLIKQVAADLGASLPNLKTFVTLSPVPGLTRWLHAEAAEGRKITKTQLDEISGYSAGQSAQDKPVAEMIERLAADYLVNAKRPDGQPVDPVARFHLGNGARLEHIRPGADDSSKGMQESFGVMVNYLYDLSKVEENHEAYAQDRRVIARKSILAFASANKRAKMTGSAENAQHTV